MMKMAESDVVLRLFGIVGAVVAFQVVVAHIPSQSRESKRRLQHALTGHLMVQISYILPYSVCLIALMVGAAGISLLKLGFPATFRQAFGPLLRPHERERHRLPGAFWFLVGTAWAAGQSSNMQIARYAVECLALADPMAAWIGRSIPSPRIQIMGKVSSLSGSFACFGTATLVGWWMLPSNDPTLWVVGGLACTVAEALPGMGGILDDNLTIPVVNSFVVDWYSGFEA